MQSFALYLSIIALALSMFNAGLVVARKHYRPQLVSLQKKVDELETRKPVIIHRVDNAGALIDDVGKITDKQVVEGYYTVTIGSYGKFLVTKKQYDSIKIGDGVPDYLKKRGN
ncbi:MAG: DUF1372 family protein [Streptococcus anginosus]|nr:DUF1372 family protein [Streptococcus anginosus]